MGEFSNLLLARLNANELRLLRPHLESVVLHEGQVLAHPGEPVSHVYFVETCVLAIVSYLSNGDSVAIAATGNEGVGAALAVLGTNIIPYRVVVQIPGTAFRIDVSILKQQLMSCGQLLELLHRHLQLMIGQFGQSAICNRYHSGRERLARWLLEAADRSDADVLPLTHDFIAQMIGGARSLVSTALMDLREEGALESTRAHVRLNRAELKKHACECYEAVKSLQRLLQP